MRNGTQDSARCLGVFLSGSGLDELDERGQPITDENFVLLMNAHHEDVPFTLPHRRLPSRNGWRCSTHRARQRADAGSRCTEAGDLIPCRPVRLHCWWNGNNGNSTYEGRRA